MGNYLPIVFFIVIVVGLIAVSTRARRRQAAAQQRRMEQITVGAEVMTTSGLYGVVVARDVDDDTVTLAIAAGVEVKWALAALRTLESLPTQYRKGEPRLDDHRSRGGAESGFGEPRARGGDPAS